eukprot:6227143-Prymnesium_polylepis.1
MSVACQHGTHVDVSVACCSLRRALVMRVPASWPYCLNAGGRGESAPKTRMGFCRVFRRWCYTYSEATGARAEPRKFRAPGACAQKVEISDFRTELVQLLTARPPPVCVHFTPAAEGKRWVTSMYLQHRRRAHRRDISFRRCHAGGDGAAAPSCQALVRRHH